MNIKEILESLNDDQKKPVLDYQGPCFIVAGPGSGKTHTIISRTQYMICDGIDPSTILLFTFTNKAAKEIKNRVIKKIGKQGEKITVGTYHSVCARILREYAELIGFTKDFTIYDADDCLSAVKKLAKGINIDSHKVCEYISNCKNKMISPSRAIQNAESDIDKQCSSIYQKYQNELVSQNAMDFDDLIYYCIILFERNSDILQNINNRFHYVVADEFHDSCQRDIRLIELLAGPSKNVCMILDDEQSIYSFRGADLESVLNVNKIFTNMKTFILRRNYRSTKSILNAARSLITKNQNQIKKELFTENEQGEPVVFIEEENQSDEALRVMRTVLFLCNKYHLQYKDIAILYRMSYLSRAVEEKLLRGNIPYCIIGGTPFYARKEIKDLLCYMRIVQNPYDFEAFKRVINVPKRGIGETSVEQIYEYAKKTYSQPISYLQAAKEIELKGKAKIGLQSFNYIMDNLVDHSETDNAMKFVSRIISETGYTDMLYASESTEKAEDKLANVIELTELASGYDNIESFLQDTSLDSQVDEGSYEDDNRVRLQTMHSAKGLEYKAVIIIEANEGVNPHWKALDPKELDEERRLFYVAMTRAMKYLFILRPKIVTQQGQLVRSTVSRFIKEIDKKYIQKY
jgi:DNA helicase-2/ATP-dependent DNA helicase PcrA